MSKFYVIRIVEYPGVLKSRHCVVVERVSSATLFRNTTFESRSNDVLKLSSRIRELQYLLFQDPR
jgi:hypothetical protein